MGLKGNWEEMSRLYTEAVRPHLIPGEELIGVVHATHRKAFSAVSYAIGVTPGRLVMVPTNRRAEASGPPVSISPNDVVRSSVDGFGGGFGEFLKAETGDIRITTADTTYKLMALGGGLDNMITGPTQAHGKQALVEWLWNVRHSTG